MQRGDLLRGAGESLAAAPGANAGAGLPAPGARPAVSVCVACCSTAGMPHDAVLAVARAMRPVATVRAVLLSETGCEEPEGVEVVAVPRGTKLSKLRRLAGLVDADLLCVCDPDLAADAEACRAVLRRAVADARAGREVVAFGVVEGGDDGTLLSRVVALDKWWSHRVLRPVLWAAGVGVTLPGQFLVVSPSLLRQLEPRVDSYLDDLYLGWVARRRGAAVRRVPVVVGREDSRAGWPSLLAQRCRWMRGLAHLFRHLAPHPPAVWLLLIHSVAYYGLPVAGAAALLALAAADPLAGLCVFLGLAAALSAASRQSWLAGVAFLGVFPLVHLLAAALWWVPVERSVLTRR